MSAPERAAAPTPAAMRAATRERAGRSDRPFDVLVVGAGATGLGIAVDAALRGLSVAVVERGDLGQGTSTKSTKLIHGGVRYLRQGHVGLVREGLLERGRLLANAPHVVRPLALVAPARSTVELGVLCAGLLAYDALAGARRLGWSRPLGRRALEAAVPGLVRGRYAGGVRFHDGQFDDARLLVALARTAVEHGALLLLRSPVEAFLRAADGRIVGAAVTTPEGATLELEARAVVNAAGPWSDEVRRLDEPDGAPALAPSSGVHLTLPREFLPGRTGVLLPETSDGRVLFALPFWDRVIVGTTDVPVREVPRDPLPTADEVAFLIDASAEVFERRPTARDVLSTWSGLRPLVGHGSRGGRTASLSRDFAILRSASGLYTIAGGKWTSHRRMAEALVDRVQCDLGLGGGGSRTAHSPLHGAAAAASRERGYHGPFADATRFAHYGSDASHVRALCESSAELSARVHPALDLLAGEVVWAVQREFAEDVEDVLARRSRALLLDARAASDAAPAVARLVARTLGTPVADADAAAERFRALAERYFPPVSDRARDFGAHG